MKIHNNIVLKILSLPSVGRKTAFKLLTALKYSISTDNDIIDFVQENASILRNPLSTLDFTNAFNRAEQLISKSQDADIRLIGYFDDDFPVLLKTIDDAPLLISVKGNYDKINKVPSVAIIGTRQPSEYGMKVGVRLGEVFGSSGFNVVSGLAIGCDTAGHTGCLNKMGYTTAVMAHGLDTVYPKENKKLAAQILDEQGLLLSEYMIGQKPQSNYFVERDRIQAGLSQAVIVVETDVKGGTMHTVKFANNNKRIVAAFDHDQKYLSHPKTQGNQFLIRNGSARPLSGPESIESLKSTLNDLFKFIAPVSANGSVTRLDVKGTSTNVEDKSKVDANQKLKVGVEKPKKRTEKAASNNSGKTTDTDNKEDGSASQLNLF